MRSNLLLIVVACLLAYFDLSSRAAIYLDATNDLFAGANAPQLDITSAVVTNDATNLYFTINLLGNPVLTNWGSYAIALVTGPGGATNGNGSGAAISLTRGINYWVNCLGWGSPQLWQYNASTLTWTNIGGATFANGSNSVSLTVPYASVGLTNGASFQFDAYTFSGSGGAMDDLANPSQTINWWSVSYTNSLVKTYSIFSYTNPASSWIYYDTTNDLFTTTAPQFDISSVSVSSDSNNISFTISLLGNPSSVNWNNYAIALVTGPGGATNGNGSGALISNPKGINYWATCLGSGTPQLWQYNTNTLTWTNIGGVTFANSSSSVSLTMPYTSLGLTSGASFKFDAYSFSGTGGAMDDLANPGWASSWWNVSYAGSLAEDYPPLNTNQSPVVRGGLTTNDSPYIQVLPADVGIIVYATNTLAGAQYIIESTSNLAAATWAPVSTNLTTGGAITNILATESGNRNAFFRSRVQGISLTIHTIGDSTIQIWNSNNYPKTGWGQVLGYFFDSTNVTIDDAAVGGTSAKSFYNNYWAGVKKNIKAGDFVFVQFGINDSNTNSITYTDPETTFKDYLADYLNETRALGAYPVLITPMRADIGNTGSPYGIYALAVRELAATSNIPLIDLDVLSGALIYSVGTNYATQYFYMNLPAGVYTNYPTGSSDATHFQEMGAIAMAKLVVKGIQQLGGDTNVCKLIPSLSPTYYVNFSGGGASGLVTLSDYFPAGISVMAQATPSSGFSFAGWSGDLTSTNAFTTFIMGRSQKSIIANFITQ